MAPARENSVELRGFEPLTPSMRTERATRRSRCYTTFLHVNSLRYRLHRIEQLLALDLHNPDDLFHLELAVRIADVVRPTSN